MDGGKGSAGVSMVGCRDGFATIQQPINPAFGSIDVICIEHRPRDRL